MNLSTLAQRWRRAPRRWGHPLHALCSYFAMFPPQIPHVFVRWLTEPGDIVYDPFSGRGTAPLEACRMGRVGLGSDANPLAYVLTAAKVDPPTKQEAQARLTELRGACRGGPGHGAPAEIRMLYSPRVLGQLACLRDHLDLKRRDDRFLTGLLLGVMHSNYIPGHPARGLSISMPNTFSMSPGYVRRYIDANGLEPPDVDVFDLLGRKLGRIHLPEAEATRGRAWQQDAREPVPPTLAKQPAKLIFTSPPYLSVIKYGKYNWVRLWMLKEEPQEVDGKLMATGSLAKYLQFVKEVLDALAPAVRDDGHVCLMIGDVRERGTGRTTNLAERVWVETAEPLGWKLRGIVSDRLPTEHKVSRIWKHGRGKATKTDRVLVMSRRARRSAALPTLDPIRWTEPMGWA
jgi:DNA modification methylase